MTVPPPQEETSAKAGMAPAGLPKTSTALLVKLIRKVLLDATQSELATRSGIHENLIARYENGDISQPSDRNLKRLLDAAGLLGIQKALLLAVGDLFNLLSPPPPAAAPPGDPLLVGDLLRRTSIRLGQLQHASSGEYKPPAWSEIDSTAFLLRFLRCVLLGCTLRDLSLRTGIDRNLISRYENGKVQPGPANLDRLLAEAGLLPLKEPLLRAMAGLAALLAHPPAAPAHAGKPLKITQESDLPAFAEDLLRRTTEKLLLQTESRERDLFREA